MVASPETEPNSHPFWYATVIGIFHADVQHVGRNSQNFQPQHMEFLWVRWLGVVPDQSFGRKKAHLPKVGFVPDTDDYAFGFLDPLLVIRGCHLLPAFVDGKTTELLTTTDDTEARLPGQQDDWANFYVGIFVDCNMLMQFLGNGIGHQDQVYHTFQPGNEDEHDPDSVDSDVDIDNDSDSLYDASTTQFDEGEENRCS